MTIEHPIIMAAREWDAARTRAIEDESMPAGFWFDFPFYGEAEEKLVRVIASHPAPVESNHPVLATARAWRLAGRRVVHARQTNSSDEHDAMTTYEAAENAFIAALDAYVNATEEPRESS